MRLLGRITEREQAELLAEYLSAQGIDLLLESEADHLSVWVRDEDHVTRAREEFNRFVKDPSDPVYEAAVLRARQQKSETVTPSDPREPKVTRVPIFELDRGRMRQSPFTVLLVVLALLISAFMQKDASPRSPVRRALSFCDPAHADDVAWESQPNGWVDIIGRGQVWRLFTPAFLHRFSPLLVFNLFWIVLLGSLIESHHGTWRMGMIAVCSAVAGNVGEFLFGQQLLFGGLSGIMFGLFGYVYVYMISHPESPVRVPRGVAVVLIVWMALGFTGVLKDSLNLATMNYTQLCGLVAGMVIATWAARPRNLHSTQDQIGEEDQAGEPTQSG